MKKILTCSFLAFLLILQACNPPKKTTPTTTTRKAADPIAAKDPYVPFTKALYQKLLSNSIDLKKVQFFIDQEIVLTRYLDNGKVEVTSGVIKFINGKNVNEMVIPIYTPGVCEVVEGDALRISFEKGGNTLRFQNSRTFAPDFFTFVGANWKDGTCEVDYDNNRYRASCGSCSSVADVKLVVKQSDVNIDDRKQKIIGGNKVGN